MRPISHHDQLSVVDHLEELRTRLIVSLLALTVAFGICFWQNHQLLKLVNSPLAQQTQQQVREGHGPLGATYSVQRSARDIAGQLGTVVAFGYFVVLPAALHFFQNFNSGEFNVLVAARASDSGSLDL